jgi:hypothetical protein
MERIMKGSVVYNHSLIESLDWIDTDNEEDIAANLSRAISNAYKARRDVERYRSAGITGVGRESRGVDFLLIEKE